MIIHNRITRLLTLFVSSLLLTYCATPFSPSGGEKDVTPPALIENKSTPNKQTRFKKQDIILTFDEWIDLKNVFEQVVISPPLEYPFELKIKGKSVHFKFDEQEQLRENATYTINFGDAIRDITENNPTDIRFVFATGDYIDSLSVRGHLIDAVTGEPVEDALFMLYENPADSVVYKERPFYFAKSGKDGSFKIDNIKSGTFKGVALKDEDLNYLYSKNEMIGFMDTLLLLEGTIAKPIIIDSTALPQDSTLTLPSATNIPNLTIKLFREDLPLLIGVVDTTRYGYINLGFNQPPLDVVLQPIGWSGRLFQETDHDSLKIWYATGDKQQGDWSLLVQRDSTLNDTIPISMSNRDNYLEKGTLKALTASANTSQIVKIPPHTPVEVLFNNPLNAIDTSKIRLEEDSIKTLVFPEFNFDSISGRKLQIRYNWKEATPYRLLLLPRAVTDIFGLQNKDSIRMNIQMDAPKSFGNIALHITGLDSTKWYVAELTDKNKNSISRWTIQNISEYKRNWTALKPGEYILLIKRDDNKNGRWDSGSYDNHRQAEPIFKKSLDKLRPNWDLEVEVIPIFN